MTADRRAAAIAATIAHLGWCVTIPHTVDQIIGIHAERTRLDTRPLRHGMTVDEILSTITASLGSGGKGGHSDPTARAALWGEPDATDDDDTVATIRAAVALCHDTAVEVAGVCGAHAPPPPDPTLTARITTTISLVHRWAPLLEPTAVQLHGTEFAHLDALVRTALAETAAWLHGKADAIWRDHRGEQRQPAVQRIILKCRVHADLVQYPPDAAAGKDLCDRCLNFQERHRCEPTEAIVRRWDYGCEATPGQIVEAKAASRKTKRKAGSRRDA